MTQVLTTKELVKELQGIIEEFTGTKVNQEQSRGVLDAVFETIANVLEDGGKVDVIGFGKFETVERAERNGVNPQTKQPIVIPAKTAPKFKPAKALKDKVEGK